MATNQCIHLEQVPFRYHQRQMSTSDQRQMSICYRPISTMKNNQEAEPIQLRVLKKWTPAKQNAEFCYLFVDTHGDAIQATTVMGEKARLDSIIRIQS
ncbi:hypothetical protein Hanom_Chr06g00552341 [Helianthus anomalus]